MSLNEFLSEALHTAHYVGVSLNLGVQTLTQEGAVALGQIQRSSLHDFFCVRKFAYSACAMKFVHVGFWPPGVRFSP